VSPDSRKIRLIMELRRNGVTDAQVCGVIERLPRELFVPEAFRDQAYEDTALPIGCHQTLSAPIVGSGYHAAVLSKLCRRVYTVERYRELLEEAERRFADLGISNITWKVGDGTLGWPEQAPFQRIVVTAAANDVPPVLAEQLAVGGVMVVPVDDGVGDPRLLRVRRDDAGLDTEDLGPIRFVPLIADSARR
jgi:protein-L-isoaspartate(D-aspartate) O-methyltransferase